MWPYWSVDAVLSERQAQRTVRFLRSAFPKSHATAVDHRHSLSLHMDWHTVVMIRAALATHAEQGGDVGALIEICDEWLSQADAPEDAG